MMDTFEVREKKWRDPLANLVIPISMPIVAISSLGTPTPISSSIIPTTSDGEEIDCEKWKGHLSTLNGLFDKYRPMSAANMQGNTAITIANVSNAGAGIGLEIAAKSMAVELANRGATGPLGMTYMGGHATLWGLEKIQMAGKGLAVAGIAFNAWGAYDSYQQGDMAGLAQNSGGIAITGIGLAIPGLNVVAGIALVTSAGVDYGTNKYINHKIDKMNREYADGIAKALAQAEVTKNELISKISKYCK
jgi:hypothetical protein